MGGSRGSPGSCSSASTQKSQRFEPNPCQICDGHGHTAINCFWLYSACRECGAIRKVWKSRVAKSMNRKFLRCQHQPKCQEFQWLDEAMKETSSAGKPRQHNVHCCFHCGEEGHFKSRCPYIHSPGKAVNVASKFKIEEEEEEEDEDEDGSVSPATPAKLVVNTTLGELASALKGCKLVK